MAESAVKVLLVGGQLRIQLGQLSLDVHLRFVVLNVVPVKQSSQH